MYIFFCLLQLSFIVSLNTSTTFSVRCLINFVVDVFDLNILIRDYQIIHKTHFFNRLVVPFMYESSLLFMLVVIVQVGSS
jgi:hypothetical protein